MTKIWYMVYLRKELGKQYLDIPLNTTQGAFTLTDFSYESLRMSYIRKSTRIVTDLATFTCGVRVIKV